MKRVLYVIHCLPKSMQFLLSVSNFYDYFPQLRFSPWWLYSQSNEHFPNKNFLIALFTHHAELSKFKMISQQFFLISSSQLINHWQHNVINRILVSLDFLAFRLLYIRCTGPILIPEETRYKLCPRLKMISEIASSLVCNSPGKLASK